MDHVYPPGPAEVPPNLTAATAAYKHRAWLAMGGLAAFIVLYFALSGWFAWTAWRLFKGMFGDGGHFDLWQFTRHCRVLNLPSVILLCFILGVMQKSVQTAHVFESLQISGVGHFFFCQS